MKKLLQLPALLVAAVLALAFAPAAAHAQQKALVYCHPDETESCSNVSTALASSGAFLTVDKAYDGTNGTVDLKTVDLFQYAVVFIPSMSDDSVSTPYALLRDPSVQSRLHDAVLGRSAFYSGTPDLGTANRLSKNALIVNLATWASANYANVRGPGLVALQDNSDDQSVQYRWALGITGLQITTDPAAASYQTVRTLTAAGLTILSSGGTQLAYDNMASFGFYFPSGAPGLSMDAVGQTGTNVGGQVVLVTSEGSDRGGAVVRTDANDYAPGTPVVVTGSGYAPNETVSITLHEDPLVHDDRSFTVTADAQGAFVDSTFAPEEHDLYVRFVLTAIGRTSGRQAQTTFTDAVSFLSLSLTPPSASVSAGDSVTYTVTANFSGTGSNGCTVTLSFSGLPSGATGTWLAGNQIVATGSASQTRTLRVRTSTVAPVTTFTVTGTAPSAGGPNGCVGGTKSTTATVAVTLGPLVAFEVTNTSGGPIATQTAGNAFNVKVRAVDAGGNTVTSFTGGSSKVSISSTGTLSAGSGATIGFTNGVLASHSVTFANGSGSGTFTITATTHPNGPESGTSNAFTVNAPACTAVTVGTNPSDATVTYGTNATFTAAASAGATAPVAVQWQVQVPNGTFTDIPSANATTLTLTSPAVATSGNKYRAVFTNTCGGTQTATTTAATLTVNKASASVALGALSATYDGNAHPATATTTPGGLAVALTYDGSTTAPTNAGSYAVAATVTDPNYQGSSSGTLKIAQATAVVAVTGYTGTYDGAPHGATGTATGVNGENLSSLLTLGGAYTDAPGGLASWSFAGNTNYAPTSGEVGIAIAKATSTVTLTCPATATFTGSALTPCSAAATGAGGLNQTLTVSYSNNTGVGQASASATFGGDQNHTGNSSSTNFTILKANQTTPVNVSAPASMTYGQAAATLTATGGDGTGAYTFTAGASTGCSVSGDQLTVTNASGTCAVTASRSGDAGYNASAPSNAASVTLNKAAATVNVTGYTGTYDGAAHGAIGTATGVNNEDLSGSLSLGATFTGVPGGTASWAFNGGNNYVSQSGTAAIMINAKSASVTPAPATKTFGGAEPVLGGTLSGFVAADNVTATYTRTAGETVAGSPYTISATLAPTGVLGNYTITYNTANFTITKADATINVTGYTGTYDGAAHGATGTATGVNGENLTPLLTLGASFTTVPGGTATWIFAGDGNYKAATGSAQIVITQASQSTPVTITAPASMTYGQAAVTLTAAGGDGTGAYTFSAGASTGCAVAGSQLTVTDASGTCDVTASRASDVNYLVSAPSAPASVALNKANATVNVTGYTGTYDGAPHGATGTATGANGESLASLLHLGATFTGVPGGTASWTFDGNTNYNATSGTAAIVINAKSASVTPAPATKTFGGAEPVLGGTLSGFVAADNVTATYTRTAGETVAGSPYTISATLAPAGVLGNYAITYNTANFTITAAPTTTVATVTPASLQYSDLTTLSATVTGVGGTPTGTVQFKIGATNVGSPVTLSSGTATLANQQITLAPGSYTVTAVFTPAAATNYAGSTSASTPLAVTKEDARTTYTGQTYVSTGSTTAGTATVTLSATIQDITAALPATDASFGDIRNATVRFVNRDAGNATLCTANGVGLVSSGDTKTGVATCNWSANIGSADAASYTVGIVVDGYYTRDHSDDNTVVTVSKTTASMITGGGFLVNAASSGQYAGQSGLKTNYGFNVKYNKQLTNLQGNMNIIVRNGGRTYQIKANSMTSLTTAPTSVGGAATFAGKASIQDITDPLNVVAVDGNATLQVSMTDRGSPGTSDGVAIAVFNKSGGMWFSSSWNGTKTVEQTIAGGDLVVR